MATTTATFLRDYATTLTAKLVSVGGTGTPNAAGYACTNSNGLQSISITEALVGEFYLYAYDSLGDIAYQGYVVLADDTGTYRVEDTIAAFKADAQLGTATGGMVANAAQVLHVQRASGPVTAGAPQDRNIENASGDVLQRIYERHNGDA